MPKFATGEARAPENPGRVNRRWTSRELIDLVLDSNSFESWDLPIDVSHHPAGYQRELRAAATRAGTDESVVTGRGLVRGRPVAVLVSEFAFLGGTVGAAAATRIVAAIRRATAEALPVLASTASGGTRMQEGTPAFVRMADIAQAVMDHRAAGRPYLVHLRNPTTGGVFASWGSLGHITIAEHGALIGFLGPKVYEGLTGQPLPDGVQTAENLAAKGVIDAVVDAADLPELVHRALRVLIDPPSVPVRPERSPANRPDGVPEGRSGPEATWRSILATRSADGLGVRELLRYGCESTIRVYGTDEGERDTTMLTALTRLDGQPCVLVGQDRSRQDHDHSMGPGALRQARRAMRLAEELRLPLLTVIDTPGAELSPRAEEGAIAGEIARCMATLRTMTVPTVSLLLGQGCGGGALALFPAARALATQNSWLSPLPPEGASLIMYGDTEHAAEMAQRQRVRAVDLLAQGLVHRLVPESPHDSVATRAHALAAHCADQLRSQMATRTV